MNETFTPPDNQNVNVCRSFSNHNICNNDSGRLVNYSGSEPESEEEQDRNKESPRHPASPPSPSTPPSPSPSLQQRRRNMQAEHVLANFGSNSLLALLGESLRREQSDRNMALSGKNHHPNHKESVQLHKNI